MTENDTIELKSMCKEYKRLCNKYSGNPNCMLEDMRINAHNNILNQLNSMGVYYNDRWEAIELAFEISGI